MLTVDITSTFDWGLLGYWIGELVQERVPVVVPAFDGSGGKFSLVPNPQRLKHFGASASSSGGVEMYHLVGVTPEANTEAHAFGSRHRATQEPPLHRPSHLF